jgi:hypothetical protein
VVAIPCSAVSTAAMPLSISPMAASGFMYYRL